MNHLRQRKRLFAAVVSLLAAAGLLATVSPAASAHPLDPTDIAATNGLNSAHADRLTDGGTGTVDDDSWANAGNRWSTASYPMVAVLDLGGPHSLESLRFHTGQVPFPATAEVTFGSSLSSSGPFSVAGSATNPRYNKWSNDLPLSGTARYIEVRFNSRDVHFNLSEVEIEAHPVVVDGEIEDAHLGTTTIDSFGEEPRPNTNLGPGWAEVDNYFANFPRQPGECSQELHDSYWVLGQDGNVHPTWHPTIHPSGCSFAHEHGDDPRESDIYDESDGVPFAITTSYDDGGMVHEGHPGYKTTVQNDYELVQGNPFNRAPVSLTGITCDWLSNIHQGSSTDNALKNNAHAYQLNNRCSDGVAVHIKTILTFGPPEIVTNLCSNNGTEAFQTGLSATMGTPVIDALDGKREFQCLEDAYGEQQWKPTTKKWFEELWKADGVIDLPGEGKIEFSPYYGVHDPQRFIDHEWTSRGLSDAYLPTLDLCFDDNSSYRSDRDDPSFCEFVTDELDGLSSDERLRDVHNPMKGVIRSIHPKDFGIRSENVPGGEANVLRFCTTARGQEAEVLEAGEECPNGKIEQSVNRQDRWYEGYAGSSENSEFINGQLTGSGMFNEWTRDFSDPTIRYPN